MAGGIGPPAIPPEKPRSNGDEWGRRGTEGNDTYLRTLPNQLDTDELAAAG